MATYGIDRYSLAKYGSSGIISQGGGAVVVSSATYLVQDIQIIQNGIKSLLVRVETPTDTTYTKIRLVRNTFGFPYREDDGVVLVEDDGPITTGELLWQDDGLEARFYYYGVFILIGSTWHISGVAEGLAVDDYGYSQYLYDLIPRVYKARMDELTDPGVDFENTPLRKFVETFGFHLDLLRTEYSKALEVNDVNRVPLHGLNALSHQLGIDAEPTVSAWNARERVRTASYVYREKGTPLGLRNAINSALGWDATVSIGPNSMLNWDQSKFFSPTYPIWDPNTNYPAGALVQDDNAIAYQALTGTLGDLPASSPSQWSVVTNLETYLYLGEWDASVTYAQPSVVSSGGVYYQYNNATPSAGNLVTDTGHWSVVTPTVMAWGNKDTNGYNSWEQVAYSGGATFAQRNLKVLTGHTTPDSSDPVNNVLQIRSPAGSTTGDIGAHSVAHRTSTGLLDRGQVATGGIPFEVPQLFNANDQYEVGDVVRYQGYIYESLSIQEGTAPTGYPADSADWRYISRNDQDSWAVSAYSQSFDTAVPSNTGIEWYDTYGNLIATFGIAADDAAKTFYDSFDYLGDPLLVNNVLEGGNLWTATGQPHVYQGYVGALSGAGFTYAVRDYGMTDVDLGLTFRTAAVNEHGLLLRYVDKDNHWRISRSSLILRISGTDTVKATWTPLEDNDRVVVIASGNTITVKKYMTLDSVTNPTATAWQLTQLATDTESVPALAAATKHGFYNRD